MMYHFNVTGAERKALVKKISEVLETKEKYLGVPSCAYQIGDYYVSKDGILSWGDMVDAGPENLDRSCSLIAALEQAGFIPDEKEAFEAMESDAQDEAEEAAPEAPETPAAPQEAETDEAVELTVSFPMSHHTGRSLRNLVNLFFTRASLLNKALGTGFSVEEGLIEALQDEACILTIPAFLKAVATYEDEHGKAISGITITPEEISFSSLPETDDPDRLKAFTELIAMMNKQAIEQKRIQAKAVNEENEKYALRIWLTRLGMNGAEYKTTRKVLMENLTGHCAFRTDAEKERWQQRQAEKRLAAKAQSEEVSA